MSILLEKKKKALENEKAKLILKEKLLVEQTKKKRVKFFQDIGRLAYKAGIDEMNKDILFGAFLEIAENKNKNEKLEKWQSNSNFFNQDSFANEIIPLVIKVKNKLDANLSAELKKIKFKWNPITKDYYGKGNPKYLNQLLTGIDFKLIEVTF